MFPMMAPSLGTDAGQHRNVLLFLSSEGSTFSKKPPSVPKPVQKQEMRGEQIFQELCLCPIPNMAWGTPAENRPSVPKPPYRATGATINETMHMRFHSKRSCRATGTTINETMHLRFHSKRPASTSASSQLSHQHLIDLLCHRKLVHQPRRLRLQFHIIRGRKDI